MISSANLHPLRVVSSRNFAVICEKTRFVDMPNFERKPGKKELGMVRLEDETGITRPADIHFLPIGLGYP